MYVENEITAYDGTLYSFVYKGQQNCTGPDKVWYVVANHNGEVFETVYDKGRFDNDKYSETCRSESDVQEWASPFWDWFKIARRERQAMRSFMMANKEYTMLSVKDFRQVNKSVPCKGWSNQYYDSPIDITATEITNRLAHNEPVRDPTWDYALPCAKEENPMRAYPDTVTTSATTITLAPSASAIGAKTDLQTEREHLLGRWRETEISFDRHYGDLATKLRKTFNIDFAAKRPATATELFAAIAAGTIKIDAKKQAMQDIAIANDHSFYEDDDYIPTHDFTFAIDFGDPTPDRLGYETAMTELKTQLKAAKDIIMIGAPADGLAAIQAIEAWAPTAATA